MNDDRYISIAGCVLLVRSGQMPKFEYPLCPKCKNPLHINEDAYSCQSCLYSTNRRQTDEAIARHKARYS